MHATPARALALALALSSAARLAIGCVPYTTTRSPEAEAEADVGPDYQIITADAGGAEIQTPDWHTALGLMWRHCPAGYRIVRKEEVPVGSTSVSRTYRNREWDVIGRRYDETHTTTESVNELRIAFACTAPRAEPRPSASAPEPREATGAGGAGGAATAPIDW